MLLVIAVSTAAGAYPEIRAAVSAEKATVGDEIEYEVKITGDGSDALNITVPGKKNYYPPEKDDPKKNSSGNDKNPSSNVPVYSINDAKKYRVVKGGSGIRVSMKLSYYRPGRHQLPEIDIRDGDGTKVGYRIPEIEVNEINREGTFQEIDPPLDLGGNYYRIILAVLGLAAACAIAFFAYRYFKRRKEQSVPPPARVPPIDVFRRQMDEFNGMKLIEDGMAAKYAFGISMIFRGYLSLQMSFDAMDMTSDEILKTVASRPGWRKFLDDMSSCFSLWDLSKYAEFSPSRETMIGNMESAVRLAERISREIGNVPDRV
jgi:hypothetical protein